MTSRSCCCHSAVLHHVTGCLLADTDSACRAAAGAAAPPAQCAAVAVVGAQPGGACGAAVPAVSATASRARCSRRWMSSTLENHHVLFSFLSSAEQNGHRFSSTDSLQSIIEVTPSPCAFCSDWSVIVWQDQSYSRCLPPGWAAATPQRCGADLQSCCALSGCGAQSCETCCCVRRCCTC